MLKISVIDCAVKQASLHCFNQLVDQFAHKFHYHHPPLQGMQSLVNENSADAYIVFGSASNVEDQLDWHRELSDFCLRKLRQKVPIFGICFGHQLLGHKLGLEVIRNKDNESFYGTRKIKILKSLWGFKENEELQVFTAHSFSIECSSVLSQGFDIIASSDECETDIITHHELPFLGIQAHPEASLFFVENEIEKKGSRIDLKAKSSAQNDGFKIVENFIQGCEKLKHKP